MKPKTILIAALVLVAVAAAAFYAGSSIAKDKAANEKVLNDMQHQYTVDSVAVESEKKGMTKENPSVTFDVPKEGEEGNVKKVD